MSDAANGIQSFLAMGGYAPYVWGSFGLAAAVVVGELLALRARRRALHRLIDDDEGDGDLPAHVQESAA